MISGATGNGSLVDLCTCNGTGISTTPGTQVQIWSCAGAANQSWVQPSPG